MRTRHELVSWARDKIEHARLNAPHLVSADGRAFMVHGTIGTASYLTVDGNVYVETDTWDPTPGSLENKSDAAAVRHAFFYGSKRHPELRDWIPVRNPDEPNCNACDGRGTRRFRDIEIGCDDCGGFGWPVNIAPV